jgi:hypothetical protein
VKEKNTKSRSTYLRPRQCRLDIRPTIATASFLAGHARAKGTPLIRLRACP